MKTLHVGSKVHYVSHGTPPDGEGKQAFKSKCRLAFVTEVGQENTVGLCVVNPTGLFFHPLADGGIHFEHPDNGPDGHARGGTWHWRYHGCEERV